MRPVWLTPALAATALAKPRAFSIHDDVLAFPQFEIQYPPDPVTELEAQSRMVSNSALDLDPESDSSVDTLDPSLPAGAKPKLAYDIMTLKSTRYLCATPQVTESLEPEDNSTTRTAAQEADELVRANDRGWELLQELEGQCMFYWAGWWSYRFCYGEGVKQFHQLQVRPGFAAHPPVEDTSVTGFMLGSVDASVARLQKQDTPAAREEDNKGLARSKAIGKIQVRGESRFLSQRLRGGDVCDLTGKDRMVEVQFHCNPVSQDSIAMIKEVATCSYLMIVDTPRLCNDVAFSPPEQGIVHAITCRRIVSATEHAEHIAGRLADAERPGIEAAGHANPFVSSPGNPPDRLGDVIVGAHKWIADGQKIEKSAIVGGGVVGKFIETIADSMGKKMDPEEMKKLGLGDPKTVDKLKKQLDKMAGEKKWKLDVFDTPQGREYRGVIDDGEDGNKGKETGGDVGGKPQDAAQDGTRDESGRDRSDDAHGEPQGQAQQRGTSDDETQRTEGSEETYEDKDEV